MRFTSPNRKLMAAGASLAVLTLAALSPALAQDPAAPATPAPVAPSAPAPLAENVIAVVNDNLISSYDLVQRIRLLAVTTGVQPTEETVPQLQQEALRGLVDERLQIQELRRVERQQKITIVATDQEINQEIADIARSNNTTAETLLASLAAQGISADTFKEQLRASISWQNWIGGRYGSRIRIGADQVNAVERQAAAAASKPQYQISEVLIDAPRVGGMENAVAGATQLIEQIQNGAPFPAVARQFSASATAANGGDAGWVASGELAPAVEQALEQMRPGQLSQAIPVQEGVYIIYLRDKRAGAESMIVNLKQAAVILPADAGADQLAAAQSTLSALRPKITSCTDLESAAAGLTGVVAGDLGEAEIKDLAPAFQAAANTLEVGQISEPIRTSAGLHLVAICGKRRSGAGVETPVQIESRLRGQQLALISRRYLRDLRNAATIETK
jgi:peptidyl-prolyl cis-trans isomerase SurA